MKNLAGKISLLAIAGLLVLNLGGCSKKDNPTDPVVNVDVQFDVTSEAVTPGQAYLQTADILSYTAAGVGAGSSTFHSKALPFSATASMTIGAAASLTVTYSDIFNIVTYPDGTTKAGNTRVHLSIKKNGTVVASDSFIPQNNDTDASRTIDWTVQ